jgi:hypothetical protein
MMKILLLACLLLAPVLGCAPTTAQGLRNNHAGIVSFEVDENYQSVYRKIITRARNCYQGVGLLGMNNTVQGDLYPDLQSGTISCAHHNPMYGINTFIVIDIRVNQSKTKIVYYCFNSAWCKNAKVIEGWVTQNSEKCHAD